MTKWHALYILSIHTNGTMQSQSAYQKEDCARTTRQGTTCRRFAKKKQLGMLYRAAFFVIHTAHRDTQ